MPNRITIPRWFDRHLHIRDGIGKFDMMYAVLPCTLAQRPTGAVIMGNLAAPDHTYSIDNALAYILRIKKLLIPKDDFKIVMTCYLTDDVTPYEVVRGYELGVWRAVKLYMAKQDGSGGTTNSGHGVKNLIGRYPIFEAMEKHGIPLLGHFEAVEDDVDEFDREVVSLERDLSPIREEFPQLQIVVEHVTDGRMADYVAETSNTYATVTAHHLIENRNALFRGGLNPLHYCKPVLKEEAHRLKVRDYVTFGNSKFGAGTDSAPHPHDKKARVLGCNAGVFTAPCAVELYTMVFAQDGMLDNLGDFMSRNFIDLYGMQVSSETMTIEEVSCEVPRMVGDIHVYMGGSTLPWRLVAK
jgi:dihydroorotase